MRLNQKKLGHALALMLGSSCTSALLTFALTKADETHLSREQAASHAVDVASPLELFAYQCSSIESDYDTALPADRAKLSKRLPNLAIPDAGGGWQGLSGDEQDAILLLKIRKAVAEDYVRSAVRFASETDAAQATRDEAVLLGADAWQAAKKLREHHGLISPAFPYAFGNQLISDAASLLHYWRSTPTEAGVNPG